MQGFVPFREASKVLFALARALSAQTRGVVMYSIRPISFLPASAGRSGRTKPVAMRLGVQCVAAVLLLACPAGLHAQISVVSPPNFPSTAVGSSSAPQNLLLKTTEAVTISSFTVPVSLGNKQEYTAGKVTGCATDGVTSNPAGTTCTVPIMFSPAYPGLRSTPLMVVTSAGNVNIGLNGMGTGPLLAYTPGIVSTLAGNFAVSSSSGDGGPATAATLFSPIGMAVDNAGNVYVADSADEVRRIDAGTGIISRYAGLGPDGGVDGGDGGPAINARVGPTDLALDSAGNLYITDGTRVRKVDGATGIITTVAGQPNSGSSPVAPSSGDGGPATQAQFRFVSGIALDSQEKNLYIVDSELSQIRKVDLSTGIISTLAGTGVLGYTGDGGPATSATLFQPRGVAVDASGNVFFTDDQDGVVRRVDAVTGVITTYAGDPNATYELNKFPTGPATSINIDARYVKFDSAGNLYITGFDAIRRVDAATGILAMIAVSGDLTRPGPSLPTGPAYGYGAGLGGAINGGIAFDGGGNLYLSEDYYLQKVSIDASEIQFLTSTEVGTLDSTDGPQSANVANIGNAGLVLASPTSGDNPKISPASLPYGTIAADSFTAGSPCPQLDAGSDPATIEPGNSCSITLNFEPVAAGALNGRVVLTDNSLNAGPATGTPYATQTIVVNGYGFGGATLLPGALNFGSVAVGKTSAAQTATLTNNSSAPLTLSSPGLTESKDFSESNNCNGSVASGANCTFTFTFTPQSAGSLASTFTISDTTSGAQYTVALTGTGTSAPGSPQAALTPTTANFGSVTVETTSAAQIFTLTNAGNAALAISSVSLGGTNASSFTISSNNCGSSLAAGKSCTLAIVFSPANAGSFSASLSVVDAVGTQTSGLTGTGTAASAPQAALTPTTANFGSVTTGTTSSAQTFTLKNAGNAALSITSAMLTGTNANSFAISANTCGSTLAAGASCAISVTFSPSTADSFTASLSVVDAVGTQTASLTGSGTVPAAPQAALTPASANFGNVSEGTSSAAQTFTLTNAGNAALPITSITVTGASASSFTISGKSCGSSLNAGASCTIQVVFDPSAAGGLPAALSVSDSVGTQTSSLSGTGIAPVPADFSIAAMPSAQSSYRGATVAYTVQLTSTVADNPFTRAVDLSASGLSGGASVSFSPASVVPGTSQPAAATMTVEVPALSASRSDTPAGTVPAGVSLACLGCAWLLRRRIRGVPWCMFLVLLAGVAAASFMGCSNSKTGFAVPSSSSTITITGTSGSTVHSTTVTLTVK